MEKSELLRIIGFSDEFLSRLENFEKDSTFINDEFSLSDEITYYSVHDTSELFINKQMNENSTEIMIL
jgi:hypothetical protein